MQPFDALTMRAILAEAKPVLLNRKVEKIQQISRDEVLISLRSKAGTSHLLVSAQASFGRICLVLNPPAPRHSNPPPFCQLLRKHLSSAILVGMEQLPGERIADLVFACVDELGNKSTKILTAEIMGRHSNLILWDSDLKKILGASHNVTAEMSRQREIAAGMLYARPPKQEKASLFSVSQSDWNKAFEDLKTKVSAGGGSEEEPIKSFEQWLISSFAGLGRHLAEEIIEASKVSSAISAEVVNDEACASLWQRVEAIQKNSEYKPCMRNDLSRFSVLSWWKENSSIDASIWKIFPTVNDLVDAYFRGVQLRSEIQQLKDRIRTELKSEQEKLQARFEAASKLLDGAKDHTRYKKYGDMILAHAGEIQSGQALLDCADLFSENGNTLQIELNPNISASQNAQNYYRLFAKSRTREKTAQASSQDAQLKLADVMSCTQALESADSMQDLQVLKEKVLERARRPEHTSKPVPPQSMQHKDNRTPHQRLMSTKSSDGFTIIVGRNRLENDVLISKLTHPHDIWLHAQGLEGAHVLIKLPNKKDPPQTTLKEAAQVAARFSRTGLGGRVRVVYTYGKYVKKIGKDKPGLVRYENEKTLEVDTSEPMPSSVRRLFS